MTGDAVQRAVAQLRDGGVVLVVGEREGSDGGELIQAARGASAASITFLATHGGSLVCVGEPAAGALEDPPLPAPIVAPHGLAPARRAHALGALALLDHAGLRPFALSSAVTDAAGAPACRDGVLTLAAAHGLPIVALDDLGGLVARSSDLERVSSAQLPVGRGGFTAIGYHDHADGREHMALTLGDVSGSGALVRVHAECLAGDVFRSSGCDCRAHLEQALEAIGREGRGAVVYLRGPEVGSRLGHPTGAPDDPAAAAILRDLGVRAARVMTDDAYTRVALRRGGVDVLGPIAVPTPSQSHQPLESVG